MPRKFHRWIVIGVPLCLTGFFLYLSRFFLGLSLGDESWYLDSGTSVNRYDFIYFQYWEPLYSVWYHLLALVCPQPVSRYFLSWGILVVVLATLPLILKIPGAWIYSFAIVVFPFLTVTPFVALFAGSIALFGMCLVLQRRRPLFEVAFLAFLTCFAIAFARAEFDYGVLLAAAVTLLAILFDFLPGEAAERPWTVRIKKSAVFCLVVAAAGFILYAMSHSAMQRSGRAFAQHFNIRAAEAGLIPAANAWKSNYAERTFGVDLTGNAALGNATLAEFFRANPRLFLGHIGRNLIDYRTVVLLVLIAGIFLATWRSEASRPLRGASIFLLLILVPPLIGVVVIYPREHYAIIMTPVLLIFVMQLLRPQRWIQPSPGMGVAVLVTGMALIFLFNIGVHRTRRPVSVERRDLFRVECMRAMDGQASVATATVFEAPSLWAVYLVHERTPVERSTLPQWDDFKNWTANTKPAWVSIDSDTTSQYHVTQADMDSFLQNDLGYTMHTCPADAQLTVYSRN